MSANLLMADYTGAYRANGTGVYDPIDKWWPRVPIAFEACCFVFVQPRLLAYRAVVGSLDKHVDYLRTADSLLRASDGGPTANVPVFEWALSKNRQLARGGSPQRVGGGTRNTATRCDPAAAA